MSIPMTDIVYSGGGTRSTHGVISDVSGSTGTIIHVGPPKVNTTVVWRKITPEELAEPKPRRKRDYSQAHRDRIKKRRARA